MAEPRSRNHEKRCERLQKDLGTDEVIIATPELIETEITKAKAALDAFAKLNLNMQIAAIAPFLNYLSETGSSDEKLYSGMLFNSLLKNRKEARVRLRVLLEA